jgi:hypothetical protein
MTELIFQITPDRIPRGRTSDVRLAVSHTGQTALETIQGRLLCPSSIQILGSKHIDISQIAPEETVFVRIRIAGTLPGIFPITLTRLNAKTGAGATREFADRVLEMIVLEQVEPNSNDLSLILEPMGTMVQNRINRLRYKIHNNGSLPITLTQPAVFAGRCEFYTGTEPFAPQVIPPGLSIPGEVQALARPAGVLTVAVHLQFSIQGQLYDREETRTLTVNPSNQHPPDTYAEKIQAILLVTASPSGEELIRTDKEFKNILFEMKHSAPFREQFRIEVLPAATLEDLAKEILYQHPNLIHFAGHGTESGILLEDTDEYKHEIRASVLLDLLKPHAGTINCVILNACKSLRVAQELAQCIPYVVGMKQTHLDSTALAFSKGFYEAIGAGHSIEEAFQIAKSRLRLGPFDESLTPVLFKSSRMI